MSGFLRNLCLGVVGLTSLNITSSSLCLLCRNLSFCVVANFDIPTVLCLLCLSKELVIRRTVGVGGHILQFEPQCDDERQSRNEPMTLDYQHLF
jgi:hypothetical protein